MNTEDRNPNSELLEQLSALADGELSADSRRFLLKRLAEDAELKQAWSNYHRIGESLRGNTPPAFDLSARVQAALDAEAAPASGALHGLARWVGGGAVAAAVALAAILALPTSQLPTEPVATGLAEVAPSGLREQDLRPNLSSAAHTVASGQSLQPNASIHGTLPVRYVPVLQPDGRIVLVPYSPLLQQRVPEAPLPPLRPQP
jgi:sigma-E factor negative regulatory protein RseA